MPPEKKFFVDAMLGNIARKLRFFGYDSKYFADIEDRQIIIEAKKENRIIISRDKDLVKKSEKLGLSCIFITKEDETDQFLEIIAQTKIKFSHISGDFARCSKCNGNTVRIEKSSIKENVSPKTYQTNEIFWKCSNCNKIYWEGTHVKKLQDFVNRINERL